MSTRVDDLFHGDGDRSWDALASLRRSRPSEDELQDVCARVAALKGDRCPLILLKDYGDAGCVDALLAVARGGYFAHQRMYAAQALVAVLGRSGAQVEPDLLRQLAELPDQVGIEDNPSSWEPSVDTEAVDMRAVRESALRFLNR